MREKRPSQTASLVAFYRAIADAGLTTAPNFSDPIAKDLLIWPWSALLRRARRTLGQGNTTARAGLTVAADLLALRTLFIDHHLARAIDQGVRQVVILGAGLDGRAYRMPELADVELFEVDHPATQAFKRRKIGPREPLAKELTYVAVDFEKSSLERALADAGHLRDAPTFWIWEGVVMYLTDGAVRASLETIARRSAPSSEIVINYSLRDHVERPHTRLVRSTLLRLLSEPSIGEQSTEAMHGMVEAAGFHVLEDSNTSDWAARFGAGPQRRETADRYRCLLARLDTPT